MLREEHDIDPFVSFTFLNLSTLYDLTLLDISNKV